MTWHSIERSRDSHNLDNHNPSEIFCHPIFCKFKHTKLWWFLEKIWKLSQHFQFSLFKFQSCDLLWMSVTPPYSSVRCEVVKKGMASTLRIRKCMSMIHDDPFFVVKTLSTLMTGTFLDLPISWEKATVTRMENIQAKWHSFERIFFYRASYAVKTYFGDLKFDEKRIGS